MIGDGRPAMQWTGLRYGSRHEWRCDFGMTNLIRFLKCILVSGTFVGLVGRFKKL
jgi:hypothetical protein